MFPLKRRCMRIKFCYLFYALHYICINCSIIGNGNTNVESTTYDVKFNVVLFQFCKIEKEFMFI